MDRAIFDSVMQRNRKTLTGLFGYANRRMGETVAIDIRSRLDGNTARE